MKAWARSPYLADRRVSMRTNVFMPTQHVVWRATLIALCLVGVGVSPAWSEQVITVHNTGRPNDRIDLVILGDGYTRANINNGKFRRDVGTFINQFFSEQPYQEYQRFFNVHRINVISRQSGADHPETGDFKNTALDARYNCRGIQWLICVNIRKVNAVLQRSIPAPAKRDFAIVLVNDRAYGGSGGAVAVASLSPEVIELVLHEMGHTFANLADEYWYSDPCAGPFREFPEVNATIKTRRDRIKWRRWIHPSTPTPTRSTTAAWPGLYEGGKYCPNGVYRPTYNSKMRSLGKPFEQINREQHIRRMYNVVSPISRVSPTRAALSVVRGTSKTFTVRVQRPMTHTLTVFWRFNGKLVGNGRFSASGWFNRYVLNTAGRAPGTYRLRVVVRDSTPWVRGPRGELLATHEWTVTVTPPLQR